jgi:hypothetical protein
MGVGPATADEIWIPLDRSTLLVLHNDEMIEEGRLLAPRGYSLDNVNAFVVSQADREVYCHPDDVARLDQFDLPDPDRPVLHVNGAGWVRGTTDGVNKPPVREGHRRYRRPQ